MIFPFSTTQNIIIYRNGTRYHSKSNLRKMVEHDRIITAMVQNSLYNTAKRNAIPMKLISQMTKVLNWQVNFAKEVRTGNQFTIIYKEFYIKDKLVAIGDILAVSYRTNKRTAQAIRYTNHAGATDYYTPLGTNFKKAFDRYPMHFSHISSTFSLSRYHPILHYKRAHQGVDLAARIGTPIHATGDGRIAIIGRQGGYGNMIKIQHNRTFSTLYGHMLKFQKGLSRGSMVRRGQVIGYVGQSGLASGPHCHYEVHMNHQPKNPTTVQLPSSIPLTSRELAIFKAHVHALLAKMQLFEKTRLASKGHSKNNIA
jgi:murein DD-endopeptidase MepM/ murein hydrolase activator NlpD